jgi:hypothetical protein
MKPTSRYQHLSEETNGLFEWQDRQRSDFDFMRLHERTRVEAEMAHRRVVFPPRKPKGRLR